MLNFLNYNRIRPLTLNKLLIFIGGLAIVFMVAFFAWWQGKEIIISNNQNGSQNEFPVSSISGVACENYNRRPAAVMLASDPITRPLSGLSRSDMVFEMPVTPGGVTRIMAIYQCDDPEEIGSIRSAREDFITLAAGLKATYIHWGGEREALKKLDSHIIDNLDAMIYENKYFYRKSGVPQPHNGFIDGSKIRQAIDELDYAKTDSFSGYPRLRENSPKNILNLTDSVLIDYPRPYDIVWTYDAEKRNYKRSRGGSPEIDKNNQEQVSASVVIIMRTESDFTNKDYLFVKTTGRGIAEIYQGGLKISGLWEKDPSRLDSKLFFYDNENKEIEFMPGKIWIEIVAD